MVKKSLPIREVAVDKFSRILCFFLILLSGCQTISIVPRSDGPGSKYSGGYIINYNGCSVGSDIYSPGGSMHHYSNTLGKRVHAALDIYLPIGYPVMAVAPGTVIAVTDISGTGRYDPGGNSVWIRHDGFKTGYVHLNRVAATQGTVVQRGEVIGYAGQTGAANKGSPHLHLAIRGLDNDVINAHELWYRPEAERVNAPWNITVPDYNPDIKYKSSEMTFPVICETIVETSRPYFEEMKRRSKQRKLKSTYQRPDLDALKRELQCAWDKSTCPE